MTFSNVVEDSIYWTVQSCDYQRERWFDVVYRLGNDDVSRFYSLEEASKWYDRSVSEEMERFIAVVHGKKRPPIELRLVSHRVITSLIDSYSTYDDTGDSWELVG